MKRIKYCNNQPTMCGIRAKKEFKLAVNTTQNERAIRILRFCSEKHRDETKEFLVYKSKKPKVESEHVSKR